MKHFPLLLLANLLSTTSFLHAKDTLIVKKPDERLYRSCYITLNSLINKETSYRSFYESINSDGYFQDVTVHPKNSTGLGIGFILNTNFKRNNKWYTGLANEISLYREHFEKRGIENDMAFTSGKISQKSNYVVYQVNAEIGYHLSTSSKGYLDMSVGLGIYTPVFSYGNKTFTDEKLGNYNSQKWAYLQIESFIFCPIKFLYCFYFQKRKIGIGAKTAINDSYSYFNQNIETPDYANSNSHHIGFNGISSYSLKTHNNPTKTLIINIIINFQL